MCAFSFSRQQRQCYQGRRKFMLSKISDQDLGERVGLTLKEQQ